MVALVSVAYVAFLIGFLVAGRLLGGRRADALAGDGLLAQSVDQFTIEFADARPDVAGCIPVPHERLSRLRQALETHDELRA